MPDKAIVDATTKLCIEFQEVSAASYKEARRWIDGHDRYAPRVIATQQSAAFYAAEARKLLMP